MSRRRGASVLTAAGKMSYLGSRLYGPEAFQRVVPALEQAGRTCGAGEANVLFDERVEGLGSRRNEAHGFDQLAVQALG